jgi:hypothetical protein
VVIALFRFAEYSAIEIATAVCEGNAGHFLFPGRLYLVDGIQSVASLHD